MKKVRFIVFTLSVILVMYSCDDETYNSPEDLFSEKTELKGEKLDYDGLQVNAPLDMLIVDSLLFIHDKVEFKDEIYLLSVSNNRSNELINYFGKQGDGPDEFTYPVSISRVPGNAERVGVYNRRDFSFSQLEIEKILSDEINKTISRVNELNIGYSMLLPLNEDLIVGTGFFKNGRYGLSGSDATWIGSQLDYPFNEDHEEMSNRSLGMAYQSHLSVHPGGNIFVSATTSSPNLDIVKVTGDSLEIVTKIHSNPVLAANDSEGNRLSVKVLPDNRAGFQSLAVTDEYIYGLYSGIKRSEGTDKYLTGQKVLRFDWEGNPDKQFNLDLPAKRIGVDPDDSTIYTIAVDTSGTYSLVKYQLD